MAKNNVILLIRHAEKPEFGEGLSPEGVRHAEADVGFFARYHVGEQPLKIQALFAAADTKASFRPRLTLAPLSKALGIPINTEYADKETDALAAHLKKKEFNNEGIVVCWKHGQILELATALVGDPRALPKQARWPEDWKEDVYSRVLQIVFGDSGALDLANTYCIEHPATEGS
jgi:hypothetical protein